MLNHGLHSERRYDVRYVTLQTWLV